MQPLISVIIAVADEHIHDSFFNKLIEQTYPNLEIILILTTVSSENKEKMADFCRYHQMLSYEMVLEDYHPYNQGLSRSHGDYVIFYDGQDFLGNDGIEKLFYSSQLANADMAISHFADFSDETFYFYQSESPLLAVMSPYDACHFLETRDAVSYKTFSTVKGKLMKKSLFETLRFSEDTTMADLDLIWQLYLASETIVFLNTPIFIFGKPKDRPLSETYLDEIHSYQKRLKALSQLEDYDTTDAFGMYYQMLANLSEDFKQKGEEHIAHHLKLLLLESEQGVNTFLELSDSDFTIVSNNCWGGYVYQNLHISFNTPFIGLFILPEDYYKLTANFRDYMEKELWFDEHLTYFPAGDYYYPVGHLGDVTLHFLHYKTSLEAKEKWERRKARINYDNLYFKFDNADGASDELLKKFDQLPYHNKVIFVHKPYPNVKSAICLENQEHLDHAYLDPNVYTYFDMIEWLNKGGTKL